VTSENLQDNTPPAEESRDEALDKAVRALPRELAPERDLWLSLATRLPERRQRRHQKQAGFWAAAAALGALWFSTLPAPAPSPDPAIDAQQEQALAGLLPLDMQLRELYETTQAAQLATLPLLVRPDLRVWDTAIGQVHDALRLYPDDPYLLDQLDRLYRQRLQALQQVALSTDISENVYY